MNIHGYSISRVNGPGKRFTLWTQGCFKKCKNCFNPETWNYNSNKILSPYQIFELIKNYDSLDGITITGGDPFEQEDDLMSLLFLLSGENYKKGVIVFSGYTKEQIEQHPIRKKCLEYVDVLIDGLYVDELNIGVDLRGSSNQQFYFFSNKIKEEELKFDHEIEISSFDDNIIITGFPKIDRKYLKQFGVKIN
jgi:anaerobic ribonucleoside-triphosphate reductase activating protein